MFSLFFFHKHSIGCIYSRLGSLHLTNQKTATKKPHENGQKAQRIMNRFWPALSLYSKFTCIAVLQGRARSFMVFFFYFVGFVYWLIGWQLVCLCPLLFRKSKIFFFLSITINENKKQRRRGKINWMIRMCVCVCVCSRLVVARLQW